MFFLRRSLELETERLVLRLPQHSDYRAWARLRHESRDFLTPWEPIWSADHLTRRAFTNRVYWSAKSVHKETAVPLFITRKEDGQIIGAITLDNIRRGPTQSGTLGYWTGAPYTRNGYMREAISVVVDHAFETLDLSRVEAACLPDNTPSRNLLEKCSFKYEGVAQAYIQINGRWRTHVLYASLRHDRRGRVAMA